MLCGVVEKKVAINQNMVRQRLIKKCNFLYYQIETT